MGSSKQGGLMTMELVDVLRWLNFSIALLFTLCYAYQFFYLAVPLVKRDKPHRPVTYHRFAVLISARNEEAVLGHLLDSIRAQDYPSDLITTFVVADNCTDATAQVARAHGAVVYERFNRSQVGKGYALDFLLQRIHRDYGSCFDGFFVFDADNLLQPDYITQMNRTFSDGYSIVTSYRNSKNFGSNWISAGYGLWFLREAEFLNHARSLLGTSCAVSGTGFLFHRNVLTGLGGWRFYLLTEDIEFTIASILSGYRVGYCKDAVLFDEQPVTFRQSWRQRLRWAKGYLQVFRAYGLQLVKGIFREGGFACFDMTMAIMPAIALTVLGMAGNLTAAVLCSVSGQSLMPAILSVAEMLANTYLLLLFLGGITTATQWKQIHTTTAKKLLYTLTFPLFMMTYIPISFAALFQRVEWKPIEHTHAMTLAELEGKS